MTQAALVETWAIAFLVTLAVEVPMASVLLRPCGAPLPRRAAIAVTAQFATHPIVWFVMPALGWSRVAFLLWAESFAVVGETLVYLFAFESLGVRRALATSVAANAASLAVGLLLLRMGLL